MIEPPEPAADQPLTRRIHHGLTPLLEDADALIYTLVGVVFLAGASAMLGYTLYAFPGNLRHDDFPTAIITLVNDLLLVMIIMEVLRTVISYLQERGSSLKPFLFIAAISATRRVLAIGAAMSVEKATTQTAEAFRRAMIDLGVNAAVILVVVVALFLLSRHREDVGRPERL